MREVVLDTETTGLYYDKGDRIVEIGCLELFDCTPTGKTYQQYINPLRQVHPEATKVSGITTEFLQDFPTFDKIADDFLNFIGDDTLVIHNANFDIGFLNMELRKLNKPLILESRVIDTLKLARKKVTSAKYNLDALCAKFEIDTSARTLHGALVDCDLLAKVYMELCGGRQKTFSFLSLESETIAYQNQSHRPKRYFNVPEEEKRLHQEALNGIKNPMWLENETLKNILERGFK